MVVCLVMRLIFVSIELKALLLHRAVLKRHKHDSELRSYVRYFTESTKP